MMDAKTAAISAVNNGMEALGLTYQYDRFEGTPAYPYFTGSYREIGFSPSQGRVDALMTVTGWDSAEGVGRLLTASEAVKAYFDNRCTIMDGYSVATDRAGDYELPLDDAKTKRVIIQIALRIYGK